MWQFSQDVQHSEMDLREAQGALATLPPPPPPPPQIKKKQTFYKIKVL